MYEHTGCTVTLPMGVTIAFERFEVRFEVECLNGIGMVHRF
jgi:hypothetical protein